MSRSRTARAACPILKDIPLIGGLFRTNKKSGRQMERLILITPRIVTLGTGNVPARVDAPDFRRSATQPDYELRPSPKRRPGRIPERGRP